VIEVKRVTKDIIEVKEVLMGWNTTDAKYVYFDLANRKKSGFYEVSTDCPVMVYDMVEEGIRWVEMFYLPKIDTSEEDEEM
jgi:hypothetical protein